MGDDNDEELNEYRKKLVAVWAEGSAAWTKAHEVNDGRRKMLAEHALATTAALAKLETVEDDFRAWGQEFLAGHERGEREGEWTTVAWPAEFWERFEELVAAKLALLKLLGFDDELQQFEKLADGVRQIMTNAQQRAILAGLLASQQEGE